MRNVALFALTSLVWAACEAPKPQTFPGYAEKAADSSLVEAAVEKAARPHYFTARPLHELGDSTDRVERTLARARGVVVTTYVRPAPRELSVINDTVRDIQTVARVRFYPARDGGWTDTIWTRDADLYGGLVRATHDDYGLPVASVHGAWLRVIYAFRADGTPQYGWVRLVPGKLVYHDADRQMFEFSTSLVNPGATEFFAAPEGPQIHIDLDPSHTLRVVRTYGDWIQVVIMRPDTSACTGDESLNVLSRDTAWVRRYDATGRRQLQSAIAGC